MSAVIARQEQFRGAVEDGVLKLGGKSSTLPVRLDTQVTEKVFGMRWKGFRSSCGVWWDIFWRSLLRSRSELL